VWWIVWVRSVGVLRIFPPAGGKGVLQAAGGELMPGDARGRPSAATCCGKRVLQAAGGRARALLITSFFFFDV